LNIKYSNISRTVLIYGYSRSHGNTRKIIDYIGKRNNIEIINLSDYNIDYFDYDFKNGGYGRNKLKQFPNRFQ